MSARASQDAGNGIDVDALRVFVAVARARSFSAGGERLSIPPSTVSRAIARLEEAVGARLLHRTSRAVTLTEDGARLLEACGPALDELGEGLRRFVESSRGEPAGRLRVSAPVQSGTEVVAPALFAFATRHPRVSLDLRLTNTVVDVTREGYDLAFRAGPVLDESLVARTLWEQPQVIAASRAFVRAHLDGERPLTRGQLERLPAVVSGASGWRFARATVTPAARVEVNDPRVALTAATAGLGLVRTGRDVARAASLVVLSTELGDPLPVSLFAVYPAGRFVPSRVRLAIEWVRRAGPAASS